MTWMDSRTNSATSTLPAPGPLRGTVFETYEDHRMATAAAIIGLMVPDVRVVDVATTSKTLPDFVGMWLAMLHTEAPEGGTP